MRGWTFWLSVVGLLVVGLSLMLCVQQPSPPQSWLFYLGFAIVLAGFVRIAAWRQRRLPRCPTCKRPLE